MKAAIKNALTLTVLIAWASSGALADTHPVYRDEGGIRPLDGYVYCLDTNRGEFVINSEDDYRKLQARVGIPSYCHTVALPPIDFTANTLIGKYTSGTCGAGFQREIVRDDDAKVYRYVINIRSVVWVCSGPPQQSMNDVVIPKIPEGYKVRFEVNNYERKGQIRILSQPGEDVDIPEDVKELLKKEGIETPTMEEWKAKRAPRGKKSDDR